MVRNTKIMRCGPRFYTLTRGLKTEFNMTESQVTDALADFLETENFVPIIYTRGRKNKERPPRGFFS